MPLLSVVIPVYNEAKTIRQIIEKINVINIDKEIVVVNNGSYDGTEKILGDIKCDCLKVIHHATNRGKGGAVLTGLSNSTGEFVIIQDADLEYDPDDYPKLMQAIKEQGADIVLGVRFTKGYHGLLIPKLGNFFLTSFFNLLFSTRLNDVLTCYKLLHRDTMLRLGLKSLSFDIEIEIISKAIKLGLRLAEVPVSYYPRHYSEGKKIRINDGLRIAANIIKHRIKDWK